MASYKVSKGNNLPMGMAATRFHQNFAHLCNPETLIGICATANEPFTSDTYIIVKGEPDRDGCFDLFVVRQQTVEIAYYSALIVEVEARVPSQADDEKWHESATVSLRHAAAEVDRYPQKNKAAHVGPHNLQVFDEAIMSRLITAATEDRLMSLDPRRMAEAAKRFRQSIERAGGHDEDAAV